MVKKLIGQMLIERGHITADQLEEGLSEQKKRGGYIGETLIALGLIDPYAFYPVLSAQLGIEFIRFKELSIPAEIIKKVPAKFASHYKFMPVRIDGELLTIGVTDPLDIQTMDDIRLVLGYEIKPGLASEVDIIDSIKKYYGIGAETIEGMISKTGSEDKVSTNLQKTQNIDEMAEDASIIKFVNQILLQAYKDHATDIHIEPYEDEVKVRYRVDGILYEAAIPPTIKHFQSAIVSRIKIMSDMNIAERRLPQDGRIKVKIGTEELDLRVSVLPTPHGESVDIRILSTAMLYSLENLGLLEEDRKLIGQLIQKPHGIIFVTGPTGSGKTTTLYACLNRINSKEKKILTIEDPIEYQLKGITQMQVQPKIGLSFALGLRSMLRHDPDIMMVGEVRDYETAQIAIRVSLTGHLVFSTLHTNDAPGGVTRLLDMGVEPYLVSSSLECFIAQRLVRLICSKCREKVRSYPGLAKEFGITPAELKNVVLYKGKGCQECKFTGYKGRTAIYEILVMSEALREMVLKRISADMIKEKAISLGMRTLRDDGWIKIKKGLTTPDEVLRVTEEI
ncbi:MAG: Flp pilus assembly complex ATPase component TadA [Candidatus Omnitrophica bacterium]|nr:Flp pilus assembly complex ATPase component TadA [Candidatus Omnitrophota bacterium]